MIVLETHGLAWWVDGDAKKLSHKARQAHGNTVSGTSF
jgi:PIN domain nuclease of toxin-antitoxin system